MDELKPCPFCGGKAKIYCHTTSQFGEENKTYHVQCTFCEAAIPEYWHRGIAIKAWNRRESEGKNNDNKWSMIS